MYESREEAAMRLEGTVIQGPNGLVYVKCMESNSRMSYVELMKRGGWSPKSRTAHLDEGFSIKPFALGYFNRGEHCYYVQRMPVRKYKQGLHEGAIRVLQNGGKGVPLRHKNDFLYGGEGFGKMYLNEYSSLEEVRHRLGTGECVSSAFGREWALGISEGKAYSLFYKARLVGVCNKKTGEITLEAKRKYLQEALMEVMV